MKVNTGIDRPRVDDSVFWSVALTVLKEGGHVRFEPPGGSMNPFIRHGETVTLMPCSPRDLKFGDIILYCVGLDPAVSPKRIHRVVKRRVMGGECLLLTKGDACTSTDAPVAPRQVLGKVSTIEKGAWTLDLATPFGKAINLTFAVFQRWLLLMWIMSVGCKVAKLLMGLPDFFRLSGLFGLSGPFRRSRLSR